MGKLAFVLVFAILVVLISCTQKQLDEKPQYIETPAFIPPAKEPGAAPVEKATEPGQQAVPQEPPAVEETIILRENSAEPFNLIIAKGTKVTFINKGNGLHRIRINETLFYSERISPGDSLSYTFTEKGDFPYRSVWSGAVSGVISVYEKKDMITGKVPVNIKFDREGFFDILNVLIMTIIVGIIASYVTSRRD